MKDETETEDIITLKKKADAYWVLERLVHIKFTKGFWKRGIIKEVKQEFFILEERMEGKIAVFFSEIKDIQPFTPKPEEAES
jgi:hypothetical protein